MYEIRFFVFDFEDMPTVYHRGSLEEAYNLLKVLHYRDFYRIEIVNLDKSKLKNNYETTTIHINQ